MCRYRRALPNAYLLAKIGFDAAENEPSKICRVPLKLGRGAGPVLVPPLDRGRDEAPRVVGGEAVVRDVQLLDPPAHERLR